MARVVVIGAGLAGLAAAHAAAASGGEPLLVERADEPGGTTALSSGWIFRYRDLRTFRWAAPHGDGPLQEAVWHGLPDALIWLERRTGAFVARGTANPLTDGVRIDARRVVHELADSLPEGVLRCGWQLTGAARAGDGSFELTITADDGRSQRVNTDAVVFAGGGYAADVERIEREAGVDIARSRYWAERNSGLSDGSSMDAALTLGAHRVPVNGECFTRAMPVGVNLWPDDYVRFSQVYGEHARLIDHVGTLLVRDDHDWADTQLIWRLARSAGRGWYLLDREALLRATPYGTVGKSVRQARDAGAVVLECAPGEMPAMLGQEGVELTRTSAPAAARAVCAVAVRPGITHTLCGLRVDASARVDTGGRRGARGLYAAGVEAGGVGNGGYASGLAQALVLGRIAGTAAAGGPQVHSA